MLKIKNNIIIFLLLSITIVLFLPACSFSEEGSNDAALVCSELESKYGIEFYELSEKTVDDETVYVCSPKNDSSIEVEAYYHKASDPMYIFPFYKRRVFIDNLLDVIKEQCVCKTIGNTYIDISEITNKDTLANNISDCLIMLDEYYDTYNVDKNLNTVYICVYFTRNNEVVSSIEFRDSDINNILDTLKRENIVY